VSLQRIWKMARTRKRKASRERERSERREVCEAFRGFKEDRAVILAEYERLVEAGARCPVCGCPLVDPSRILSVSVPSPLGIIHEACA